MKLHTFAVLELDGDGPGRPAVIRHDTNIEVSNAECALMQRMNPDRQFVVIVLPAARKPMHVD